MNEKFWKENIQWREQNKPTGDILQEELYTLYLGDFLIMPEVDYKELAQLDPNVRALFN